MGDHRAIIKIGFEFHGKKKDADMWINYVPDDNGIDHRITEFFIEGYNEGMKAYEKQMEEVYKIEHREEIEKAEKAELERLKEKYPTPQ